MRRRPRLAAEARLTAPRLLFDAASLYVRAAPLSALLYLGTTLLAGITPVAAAWLTRSIIDRLTQHTGPSVWATTVALAALGALTAGAQQVSQYAQNETSRRVTLHSQAELFAAVSRQPGLAELEDPAYQDRLRLAQQASQSGPQQLVGALLGTVQAMLTVVGFLGTLFAFSPLIATLVLLSALPALHAQVSLGRRRSDMAVLTTPLLRRQLFYAALLTDIRAAKEIRLFGLGDFFRGRMLRELSGAQRGQREVDRTVLRVDGSLALMTAVIAGFAMVTAVSSVSSGHGSVGDVSLLIAALTTVQATITSVVNQVGTVSQTLALFRYYTELTGSPAPAAATSGPREVAPLGRAVQLRDVWFRYHADHDWVLKGLDLTVRAGETVALVGLNGAGKSTVAKLLCRLYEPTEGSVAWDGTDVRALDLAGLRRRMGVVFQDFMQYDLSAADNISVGDLTALDDRPRLRRAAARAGIDGRISALPHGYDTYLSRMHVRLPGGAPREAGRRERGRGGSGRPGRLSRSGPANGGGGEAGVLLSGGQWQRLALARAVLREDADLLILDEPSSGLDPVAEAEIHRGLRDYRRGRSCLLISHRLNTVRDADRIVVLADGVIAEEGDHASLMAAGGVYAELFRLQAAGYQLDAGPEESGAAVSGLC